MSSKKELGQYFTISKELQTFVFEKVKHKSSHLLEPSFGRGHLLQLFLENDPNYPMTCCELDETVKPLVTFTTQKVIWGDFLKQNFETKFRTIIGNPPYVKQTSGNLYLKFIDRCFDLLTDDGELIFIVPSDFIKLTSAGPIISRMAKSGSFTDFLFPHDEKLFDGASVDVVIFRYQKGIHSSLTHVNGVEKPYTAVDGIISFGDSYGKRVDELFDVYVGLVSGKDDVFKVPFGNLSVLTDKDRVEKFVYGKATPEITAHLEAHKKVLMSRKIRRFSEENWFEWGAPRNITHMERFMGQPCIYVRNLTRSHEPAFLGNVQYFGGALLCMIPKKPDVDLPKVVGFLNKIETRRDYTYSGRFKMGHRQLCHIKLSILNSTN
jgi:adenine-specific DNA-methyltransferase